jgi:hypothetical protein
MGGPILFWIFLIAILIVVPFWRILPRYGISKFFALLAPLPAIALVLLWIIAFKEEIDGRDS